MDSLCNSTLSTQKITISSYKGSVDSSFVNYPLSLQHKFSFVCTYLLLNTSGMISLLILLNKLSLHHDIDSISELIYPNETLCKILTAMVLCLRFICRLAVHLHNAPVVPGIFHPNKFRARHYHSLKLGWKLKYLNFLTIII